MITVFYKIYTELVSFFVAILFLSDRMKIVKHFNTNTRVNIMTRRQKFRDTSNNEANKNKNVCSLAVAEVLGVANTVHYLHTISDIVRAARNRFTVRSRLSAVGKGKTVGQARDKFQKIAQEENALFFIVRVDGHVILLNSEGLTVCDTDPRKRDRRKVTHAFAVFKKG